MGRRHDVTMNRPCFLRTTPPACPAASTAGTGVKAPLRLVSAVALTVALLQGCGKPDAPPSVAAPAPVSVVTVHRTSVPMTVELPGRTASTLVAQVRARVDGIVLRREFKEGSDVRAGQRLYQVDPAPYQATLQSAMAGLQKAQASLASASALAERYQPLVAIHAVSQQDYDNAVAARGQAAADVAAGRAAVATAQINLGYTSVLSPISGRIGISAVTQGAYVQASGATLLATVQSLDPIYVDLTQSSVEGLQLRRAIAGGQLKVTGSDRATVGLTLEDGQPYPLKGTLKFSDISVNQGTGSVMVRAIFRNPQGVLMPGMFVRARIETGVADNAMLVPQVGVTHDPQGNATALVVGPDGKAMLRTLRLGDTSGDNWIVEGGLEDGDRVIVGGVQGARPGGLVRVVDPTVPAASMVRTSWVGDGASQASATVPPASSARPSEAASK
jgi:membrane fusion protein (multidrug efflux system)